MATSEEDAREASGALKDGEAVDMGSHMKTTIEIADPLLREAKALAHRERTTLRALIEEGLRQVLGAKTKQKPFRLRNKTFDGRTGLTKEMEARGGWSRLRDAAYPGFSDDDEGAPLER